MKLDKKRIFELTAQGVKAEDIAAQLGTCPAAISRAKRTPEYLALEAGASSRLLDDVTNVQKRVLSWIVSFVDQVDRDRPNDLDYKLKVAAVLSKYVNFSMEIKK